MDSIPDSIPCDQCEVLIIDGVPCHEIGCPNSWKHPTTGKPYPTPCFECGCDFEPEERPCRCAVCPGCATGDES